MRIHDLKDCNSISLFAAFLLSPGDTPMKNIVQKAVSFKANPEALAIAAGLSQDEFTRIMSGDLVPEPERQAEIIGAWLKLKLFKQVAA